MKHYKVSDLVTRTEEGKGAYGYIILHDNGAEVDYMYRSYSTEEAAAQACAESLADDYNSSYRGEIIRMEVVATVGQ